MRTIARHLLRDGRRARRRNPHAASSRSAPLAALLPLTLTAAAAPAQPPHPITAAPSTVHAIRVRAITIRDGAVLPVGPWIASEPSGGSNPAGPGGPWHVVYDNFPDPGECDQLPVIRDLCNTLSATDVFVRRGYAGQSADRVRFGWTWPGDGVGAEQCFVALVLAQSFDDTCAGPAFTDTYGGVLFDFGPLAEGPGAVYTAVEDIRGTGQAIFMPADGIGAVAMLLLTTDFAPATCGEPLLWGITDIPTQGAQGGMQWDDIAPRDDQFTAPNECFNLSTSSGCFDALGIALSFEQFRACPADWNRDGTVDSDDFFDFLNAFNTGNADFNGDGRTDSDDFFDYLNRFNAGC